MTNSEDQKKPKLSGAPQLTDMILGNLKPRVGKETTKWVAALSEEAMEAAAEAAQSQGVEMLTSSEQVPPKPAQVTATAFMDYLFDCFQQYEFEFNRSAQAPEMLISLERPTMVVETLREKLKKPVTEQVFRGRLSTRYWTLLLRAHQYDIEGWIMPIDQLIGFASDREPFTQFLDLRAVTRDQEIIWSVDGVEITWDKMRSFAKQLFAALIHVAKTENADGLVFSLSAKKEDTSKSEPGANTAAATAEPAADKTSFYEHNPDFEGYGTATAGQPAAPAGPTIDAALDTLQKAINGELERLSSKGQAAFAKQDMATVQKIFERTTKVKEIQVEATKLVQSWKGTSDV